MGRKRLSDDEKRAKPLRIRLNPSEREVIDAAASADGESSSEWSRQILVKSAKKRLTRKRK